VDALLGQQTRPHNDLDVIVSLDDVPKLRAVLGEQGFRLTEGQPVRCLTAEVQVRCHAGYPLRAVDFHDMQALHRRFGVQLLPEHRRPSANHQ
jgi:hypothetical protein